MIIPIRSWQFWSDWTDIINNEIDSDKYDHFILECRGKDSGWFLKGMKWNRTNVPHKGDGKWDESEWSLINTIDAVSFYKKIPNKIYSIKGYNNSESVKEFIDTLHAQDS